MFDVGSALIWGCASYSGPTFLIYHKPDFTEAIVHGVKARRRYTKQVIFLA